MNTPKVSIISPVYNAEKYLSKCIDSILQQTLSEWELLLINDGSTDASAEICNIYKSKDNRIKVFHQQNKGVSAARTTGLENAKGQYIIHVDSDDWIEPDMLKDLYSKAQHDAADVVICDFFYDNDSRHTYIKQKPSALTPSVVLKELFQQLHGSCWNKLVKRTCYSAYHISFPTGLNYCEDLITWIQLFQHNNIKISYLARAYYHYVAHKASITNNFTKETFEMRQKYIDLLIQYLPDKGFNHEINKSKLLVLSEGCMHNVLSAKEAQYFAKRNIKAIFCENRNIRWLIGYIFILLGIYTIGQKFIRH